MSKSIKQYKNAMDNIKISDSFMKRTETLLKDIPVQKENINPQPKWKVNKITLASCAGLAACLIAVIALKTGLSNSDIEANDTASPITETYTYYDSAITETETATERVMLQIEEEEMNIDGIEPIENADAGAGSAESSAETTTPASSKQEQTSSTVSTTAPKQPAADTAAINEFQAVPENGAAVQTGEADISADSVEPDPEAKLLYDINYDNSNIELQSYISELSNSSQVLSSDTARTIILNIANIAYNTQLTSTKTKFSSEFVLTVTDKTTDEESFTIYLTTNQSIVITSHLETGQSRKTYLLSSSDYTSIEKQLYLCFGSENDYEAFAALKSGK